MNFAPGKQRFSPRQEEVLDVIERVFRREGIRSVRMGDLADEAQCSRSTLYELAPSKEELLLLVLDRMMRRSARRTAASWAEADDPVDRVRIMLTTSSEDIAAIGPTFLDAVRSHPPTAMLFDRWIAAGRDTLEQLIEEAVVAKKLRPVTAAVFAEGMFAVVLRFTDPEVVRSTRTSPADALAELIDMLLDGLRPR